MSIRSLAAITSKLKNALHGRYFGKYAGIVSSIEDDRKLGRIKATVPQVLGFDKNGILIETDWCWPCFASGNFELPKIKDGVWIEFENGNPDRPIWSGVYYAARVDQQSEIPKDSLNNYETKSITTPGGHRIVLDDNQKTIELKSLVGNSIKWERNGKETHSVTGNLDESIVGTANIGYGSNRIESVVGFFKRLISGDFISQILGQLIIKVMNRYTLEVFSNVGGVPIPILKTRIYCNGTTLKLDIPTAGGELLLGDFSEVPIDPITGLAVPNPLLMTLMKSTAILKYNLHTHVVSGGATLVPNILMDPLTDATIRTKAM